MNTTIFVLPVEIQRSKSVRGILINLLLQRNRRIRTFEYKGLRPSFPVKLIAGKTQFRTNAHLSLSKSYESYYAHLKYCRNYGGNYNVPLSHDV